MRKIINGKLYDTQTAQFLQMQCANCSSRDYSYYQESLYLKRTGEYFLHGEGGPNSRYAEQVDSNCWTNGEKIIPLSYNEARQWAEDNLEAEEYESIFGPVGEDDGRTTLSISMPSATADRARRAAQERGITLSDYIASLIDQEQPPA